jgi:tRNA(adenine34) deaminase
MNPKAGCAGSVLNLLEMDGFNHKVKVRRGILEEECSGMLKSFFKDLRAQKKKMKDQKTAELSKTEMRGTDLQTAE